MVNGTPYTYFNNTMDLRCMQFYLDLSISLLAVQSLANRNEKHLFYTLLIELS